MRVLFRQAEIYRNSRFERGDVLIQNGKISAVASSLDEPADAEIPSSGLSLLPGLIDVHVHFRDPGLEKKEGWKNGSRAAVRGGVTSVLEIQNNPPLCVHPEALKKRFHRAMEGLVDFGGYANLLPASLEYLPELAARVPGFKLFMGGSTGVRGIEDRAVLEELFAAAAQTGKPIVAHCEDETILKQEAAKEGEFTAADHHRLRPAQAEERSLELALELAEKTKAKLHVFHLSTGRGAELIAEAKKKGLPVSCSVSLHNLIFSCEDAERLGNKIKVNPPIQTPQDRESLRQALRDGVIDIVATDHAPHFAAEKERPYRNAPAGIPSVEFFLPLLFSLVQETDFPLSRAIEAATTMPAEIFGVRQKARIEPGMDADLVLIDREESREIAAADVISKAGWTPYEGRKVSGFPKLTMVRGKVVYQEGKFSNSHWGKPLVFHDPKLVQP